MGCGRGQRYSFKLKRCVAKKAKRKKGCPGGMSRNYGGNPRWRTRSGKCPAY
tara:strand:- start:297 stop:452 length:156 start_codon:yes stop_codon:yes gene_type:complete